jgi:hypothetical protein
MLAMDNRPTKHRNGMPIIYCPKHGQAMRAMTSSPSKTYYLCVRCRIEGKPLHIVERRR